MVVFVIGVVKKAVIIPTVSVVARLSSLLSDDAIHSMEHRVGIACRIATAARSVLDTRP